MKKRVALIIALVIGAIVAFFALYTLQSMMPWKVNRLAKITDEYMRNKYDFEVERTGYHVNLFERPDIYHFYYKKCDEQDVTILVYAFDDTEGIEDCADNYAGQLFEEEYIEPLKRECAEIFGEDTVLFYTIGSISVAPLETLPDDLVDAGLSMEITTRGYEEEKNKFAEDVIKMIKETQNMGLKINEIHVLGDVGSYRVTNPSDSVSIDDLEYFEYEK